MWFVPRETPQNEPEARAHLRPRGQGPPQATRPQASLAPCHPQVVLKSQDDQVTVIGAGVTLHEALAAADLLKKGEEGATHTVLNRR